MYCRQCGQKIPDKDTLCPNCGTRGIRFKTIEKKNIVTGLGFNASSLKKQLIGIIGCSAIAAFALSLSGYMVLSNPKDAKPEGGSSAHGGAAAGGETETEPKGTEVTTETEATTEAKPVDPVQDSLKAHDVLVAYAESQKFLYGRTVTAGVSRDCMVPNTTETDDCNVGYGIWDLDQDGVDELLIVTSNGHYEYKHMELSVYEYQNGQVKKAADNQEAALMESHPLHSSCCRQGATPEVSECYIYVDEGKPFIALENHWFSDLFADGVTNTLTIYTYEDGKMLRQDGVSVSGSDMSAYEYNLVKDLFVPYHIGLNETKWSEGRVNAKDVLNVVCPVTGSFTRYLETVKNANKWLSGGQSGAFVTNEIYFYTQDELKEGKVLTDTSAISSESSGKEGYVFPDSDSRTITADELSKLSKEEVRRALNEIYARHGVIFSSDANKKYFGQFDWYHPTVEMNTMENNLDKYFNSYEKANRDTIITYEKKMGYRK